MQEESKNTPKRFVFPNTWPVATAIPETHIRHLENWPVLFHEPSRGQGFQANACTAAALEKEGMPARAG